MTIQINDRDYAMPQKPAVVICLDGCEPDYIDEAIDAGVMPALAKVIAGGTRTLARSAMPSFTNPNNLSIATGAPSSVHGICGNFFLNPQTGEAVMMNSVEFLRAPTIFAGFQKAGAKVAVVTAKDKLRELLGAGLDCAAGAICFSAEKADMAVGAINGLDDAANWLGLPVPAVYSGDLSIFVLKAGVKLMEESRPDILYLSTSDYIQHKHAPGTAEANAFMAEVDDAIARLVAQNIRLVLTADHGMKAKHTPDGRPDVIYLNPLLEGLLGHGRARVILPITDPYVAHHGALGAFATIHVPSDVDPVVVADALARIEGMDQVLTRREACARFDLPADRIGDLVVTCVAGKAIGTAEEEHDLTGLDVPLRSHGGLDEQVVPFIVNGPMGSHQNSTTLRNYDAWITAVGMV
ncbi:phosphonoacetate hydrolase [Paracoccus liaowanqingii]|uniref:Phosphonoacetate hydrolase n=1 Tax=Paracoccus liaowanqingii TaxID=2560053 RepID=A0A4P7HL09_9RHOB|nr:phosphonoacetate hydrolase [Paracoccus liaowanqingii]QBX34313.1 phosphonoacetate hydrolase [Paracoccus liaowanqingii]